jgi:hypothetical protein
VNNLNIHGRHPKDLPDKETINDILLELHDTNKFDINWINLNFQAQFLPRSDDRDYSFIPAEWRANNKTFDNWVEKGEVITCEMDSTFPTFNPCEEGFDSMPMSYATVKQTRYDILRHPIRVSVKFKDDILPLNKGAKEIFEASNDVYLRLKDYLGPDVIQDQFANVSFDIDFMISSLKIIK